MRRVCALNLVLVLIALSLLAARAPTAAQTEAGVDCRIIRYTALSEVLANCDGLPAGTVCGAGPVVITMKSGQVVDQPGASAQLSGVTTVRVLTAGDSWGLARLSLPDPLSAQAAATLILSGPASWAADPGGPAGAAFTLTNEDGELPCSDLARPGLLVQAPDKSLTLLRINGVELAVNGTAVIQALDGGGLAVSAIVRETILAQTGTVIFAGYGAEINGTTAPQVMPYDPARVAFLPVEILPRMDVVPLPGNGQVIQDVNLYAEPKPEAYTATIIRGGLPVNVLAQHTDPSWLYIRAYDGTLGWLPRAALTLNVPGTIPTTASTPPLPVRPLGPVQARGMTRVEASFLRAGPGQQYAIVATVPLNTALDIYARGPNDDWLLVETPDGVRAWISLDLVAPTTPLNLAEMPYSLEFPG